MTYFVFCSLNSDYIQKIEKESVEIINKGRKQRKRKPDVYLHRHLFVYLSDIQKLGSSRIRLIIFLSIL